MIGLIGGNGAIGTRVAEIARVLGMEVLISSRTSGALRISLRPAPLTPDSLMAL